MIARERLTSHSYDTEGRKVISSWREHPGKCQDVCEHDQMLKKLGDLRGAYCPLLHNLKNALGEPTVSGKMTLTLPFCVNTWAPLLTECFYTYYCYLIVMMIV